MQVIFELDDCSIRVAISIFCRAHPIKLASNIAPPTATTISKSLLSSWTAAVSRTVFETLCPKTT